jgi:hypothetical protein
MLDKTIPYVTEEGYQYLIRFAEFNSEYLPEEFTLPIVDVTIIVNGDLEKINTSKTLSKFTSLVNDYLNQNNIILYFYCSNDPILKSSKRQTVSNAQYRSDLFCRMFEKQNLDDTFICENILIEDLVNGNHHIHLISKINNENEIKLIVEKGLPYFENK